MIIKRTPRLSNFPVTGHKPKTILEFSRRRLQLSLWSGARVRCGVEGRRVQQHRPAAMSSGFERYADFSPPSLLPSLYPTLLLQNGPVPSEVRSACIRDLRANISEVNPGVLQAQVLCTEFSFPGTVHRKCNGGPKTNATWATPDFSGCVSPKYQRFYEQVQNRFALNTSPTPPPFPSSSHKSRSCLIAISDASSKSTFSQSFKEKCISEVVRIGSIIIFHLSKLWKAKFVILCDVIFLVRGCKGNLKLITLGSERVNMFKASWELMRVKSSLIVYGLTLSPPSSKSTFSQPS